MSKHVLDDNLICPNCTHDVLQLNNGEIICKECNTKYTKDGDMYFFSAKNHYYGEISQENMIELLEKVRNNPSLLNSIKESVIPESAIVGDFLREYIFSNRRTSYIDFLLTTKTNFLHKNMTSLDIGCGFGSIGSYFEEKGFKNYYVDLTRERLEFAYIKNNFYGCRNGVYILGGDKHIPVKDGSIDVVACIGVLEWIPSTTAGKYPEEIQLEFLKHLHSKIKENGYLILGIENRYAYTYMIGYPDDHTGIRFITFLPRLLSNIYSKIKGKGEYRNYLYGYYALKNILKKAGFKEIEIVYPHKDYRFARHTVRFNNHSYIDTLLKESVKNKGCFRTLLIRGLRFLNRLDLYKYVAYSFIAIAKK